MLGNSFESKVAILKGKTQKIEVILSSWKYSMENGSADLRSQSNGRNGHRQSSSPVSNFSVLKSKSSDVRSFSSPLPVSSNFYPGSPVLHHADETLPELDGDHVLNAYPDIGKSMTVGEANRFAEDAVQWFLEAGPAALRAGAIESAIVTMRPELRLEDIGYLEAY